MPMTNLMFNVYKGTSKCNETDTFEFQDWLTYLSKLNEIIPYYHTLSTIIVQTMEESDNNKPFSLQHAV